MVQIENMTKLGLAEILPLKTMTVPPYSTTNTILYGEFSFVVIDPGTTDVDQLDLLIAHIQHRIDQSHCFKAICLTHHHGDHVGGAPIIAKRFSVPIFAHEHASSKLSFKIDRTLFGDDVITLGRDLSITAIHTPGHANSHLVFYDDSDQVLMTGDVITDKGTTLIPPGCLSLSHYLESLDALTNLSLRTLIPAHGRPITKEPVKFLIRAIKHRYERIASVLAALEDKNEQLLDATDITQLVYGNTIAENVFVFAQLSVESSLHWLLEMGLVKNINSKWQALVQKGDIKEMAILTPMKQIDERLRNA